MLSPERPSYVIAKLLEHQRKYGDGNMDQPNCMRFCPACTSSVHPSTNRCTANRHITCPLNLQKVDSSC